MQTVFRCAYLYPKRISIMSCFYPFCVIIVSSEGSACSFHSCRIIFMPAVTVCFSGFFFVLVDNFIVESPLDFLPVWVHSTLYLFLALDAGFFYLGNIYGTRTENKVYYAYMACSL